MSSVSFTGLIAAALLVSSAASAIAQNVPEGTKIDVRTDETIDARDRVDGRIFGGTVANDVVGQDGRVVIPRGSRAELEVRGAGEHELTVDLESVTVGQRRFSIDASSTRNRREAVGANKRTGEYVGGGALLGTVLGAIAGGGKGAAIGALAGGAAGAGTQTITRGSSVHIPAETVISFRLDRPLDVYPDPGYDREGRHYHHYEGEQYDDRDSRYRDSDSNRR